MGMAACRCGLGQPGAMSRRVRSLIAVVLGPVGLVVLWSACSVVSRPTDACGNDLSGLHATAVGVDVASGRVVWTRDDLPGVVPGVVDTLDGAVRLDRYDEQAPILLDPGRGTEVEARSDETSPPRFAVVVPSPGSALPRVVVDGVDYAVSGGALVASAGGGTRWWVPIDSVGRGISRPLVLDGVVVVVTSEAPRFCG